MPIPLYQTLFAAFLCIVCLGLLVDAWRSGSIWAKGGKEGEPGEAWNAHKVARDDSPAEFWFHVLLYVAGVTLPIGFIFFS